MTEEKKKEELNYQFVSLIFSLQQAAMAQMGKIANPATGKMEKNLVQAKATIDMLEMLKEKSKGNLNDTEQKIVLNTLDNLYLNYADEVEKPATTEKPAEKKEEKPVTTESTEKKEEKPATADLSAEAQPVRRSPQDVGGKAKAEGTEEKKPKEEKKK